MGPKDGLYFAPFFLTNRAENFSQVWAQSERKLRKLQPNNSLISLGIFLQFVQPNGQRVLDLNHLSVESQFLIIAGL